jgi:hypothetical protein
MRTSAAHARTLAKGSRARRRTTRPRGRGPQWLDVDALATDGRSRLSGYDADELRAFVPAPVEPS